MEQLWLDGLERLIDALPSEERLRENTIEANVEKAEDASVWHMLMLILCALGFNVCAAPSGCALGLSFVSPPSHLTSRKGSCAQAEPRQARDETGDEIAPKKGKIAYPGGHKESSCYGN
jgi:hypothetical protein